MPNELLSPELALVDPELAARARAALPERIGPVPTPRPAPAPPPTPTLAAPGPAAPPTEERHPATRVYPLWARVTAILWILVIGILIGGAAVPHAQDRPRVVPPEEDATICERPQQSPQFPQRPLGPIGDPSTR